MIYQCQQDLEDSLFLVLNKDDFKRDISIYDLSREELAEALTRGLMMSWVADEIGRLEAKIPNCPLNGLAAFKNACLRVIDEIRTTGSCGHD